MTLKQHTVGSAITSAVFFAFTKSWEGTLTCFLSGIFIDLDHVLDFWLVRRKISVTYREVVEFCFDREGKIYLFLHSYELLAVLWAAFFMLGMPPVLGGIASGMSVHTALDQIVNPVYPLAYFFFYRLKMGFPKALFFNNVSQEMLKRKYDQHLR